MINHLPEYPGLLFITNSLSGGGAERATNILVNALHGRGIPVTLIAINKGPRDLIIPNCKVYEMERKWRGSFLATFKAFCKVQRVVCQEKPSALVLNCDLPELIGCFLVHKSKTIIVEHAARPWPTRTLLGKLIRRLHRLRGTTFVAVSPHLSIWPNADKPDEILLNAVDQNSLTHGVSRRSQGQTRLIHVGRLIESKQPDWILTISKSTGMPCAFIGVGPLESHLRQLALDEKIDAEFWGQVSNPYELFTDADLLLITSKIEGDGLVLIEAASLKIPFLANDIPDFKKFEISKINLCVNVGDFAKKAKDFEQGILDLRLEETTRSKILNGRSPERIASLWVDFLHNKLKINFD
jgi:glycosyltransferase involved in cell wall biosynthesis